MGFTWARPVPVKLRMAWRANGMTRGQARVGVRSLSCAGRGPTLFACLPKKIMPPNSPFESPPLASSLAQHPRPPGVKNFLPPLLSPRVNKHPLVLSAPQPPPGGVVKNKVPGLYFLGHPLGGPQGVS